MGGGAWPFLVGGAIRLVDSDNERDSGLLTSAPMCVRFSLRRARAVRVRRALPRACVRVRFVSSVAAVGGEEVAVLRRLFFFPQSSRRGGGRGRRRRRAVVRAVSAGSGSVFSRTS